MKKIKGVNYMPNISTVTALINGQSYNLTLNSGTGKYEAVITAPSKSSYTVNDEHYYDVSVTATDTANNSTTVNASHATLGESLKLVVKEKVAPVITIVSPSSGATLTNNKPVITVDITDNDSGVDTSSFSLIIDSGAAVTWDDGTPEEISDGYRWTYTPTNALGDGAHTIKINVSDNDGNAAAQKTSTVTVDTTPPTLDVTAPENDSWTNALSGTVTGTTNDATSSPVTVTIKVNSVDQGDVTVESSGAFSHEVTYVEGDNTLVITATDAAGKESTVTRTVHVNTVAPEIVSVVIAPNPVDAGSTYTITVEVE